MRLCTNCGWRPVYAKGECRPCREYRLDHDGEARPEALIVRDAKRYEARGEGADVIEISPDDRGGTLTREEYEALPLPAVPSCSSDDCGETEYSEGLCKKHADLAWARRQRMVSVA
jgi:hypothetical protein